ncbi:MAG: hypothetical protein R3B96_04140 [Pirellulaceae bacterium]
MSEIVLRHDELPAFEVTGAQEPWTIRPSIAWGEAQYVREVRSWRARGRGVLTCRANAHPWRFRRVDQCARQEKLLRLQARFAIQGEA